jgi:DNA polymerase-3 subunit epsilon
VEVFCKGAVRINPGKPIDPEASQVNKITDAMVRDCKRFEELAPEVMEFLEGCDVSGYNIRQFDVDLLK